jgi:hypothetical protein
MSVVGDLAVGSVVDGRYRIDAELGRGGMAVVYRATHLKLGRTRALKVMSAALAEDPDFRRRFEEEARCHSQIDHDHVIPVYDFGEHEGGLYIVMRFVDGQNLRNLLHDRGLLEAVRAVQVIEQVAAALDAAHERGLLHRDVKPANILVEAVTGRIYLADFGLVLPPPSEDRDPTRSKVLGTTYYMAPERLRGEETKLGDVYSLGCVLWDMIAGRSTPLPGRSAAEADAEIPAELAAVVGKAVSERPLERYASAGALGEAARAALPAPAAAGASGRRESQTFTHSPFHEPLSDGLSTSVAALCEEPLADPAAVRELERIRRRLGEPLSLAVTGKINAGKSTLVNALLGRRIARTGASDPTRFVTWFRYGEKERIEVVLSGGERALRALTPEGRIPDSLGVPAAEIVAVEVWLPADPLRALTIVDTPGFDAPAVGAEAQKEAIERANALLLAIPGDAADADSEALEAFRRLVDGSGHASAINAIGVLTKADLVAGDGDRWDAAVARAERLRGALGPLVTAVVPVAGLLAETANSGGLGEADLDRLDELARLDGPARDHLLDGGAALLAQEQDRDRLLELLGGYGVRRTLELAETSSLTGIAIVQRLRELSGIEELRKHIDALQLRADALKADAALAELESLSWKYRLTDLRNRVDRLRLQEPVLELMGQFDRCANGEVELGEGMLDELERLLTGRTAAERLGLEPGAPPERQRRVAIERSLAWRAWAGSGLAGFEGEQVADKVDNVYTHIAVAP